MNSTSLASIIVVATLLVSQSVFAQTQIVGSYETGSYGGKEKVRYFAVLFNGDFTSENMKNAALKGARYVDKQKKTHSINFHRTVSVDSNKHLLIGYISAAKSWNWTALKVIGCCNSEWKDNRGKTGYSDGWVVKGGKYRYQFADNDAGNVVYVMKHFNRD